jgi:hypothetical protein
MRRNYDHRNLATELHGYVELGMRSEARRLICKILAKRDITAAEFSAALSAIGITARRYRDWKR